MSFLETTTFERMAPGRYQGRIGPAWYQGRGAFGGVTMAALVRTIEQEAGAPGRFLRSITGHYIAPVVGEELEIRVQILRAGRYVTQVQAQLGRGEQVMISALAQLTATPGGGPLIDDVVPPFAPPPGEVQAWPRLEITPSFTHALEYRPCLGQPIFSDAREARMGGWCRILGPIAPDAAMIAALLDAWPPAFFACTDRVVPSSTVDMTCHFLAPVPRPEQPSEDFYLYEHHITWMHEGLAEEQGTLWSKEGVVLGRIRQMLLGFSG